MTSVELSYVLEPEVKTLLNNLVPVIKRSVGNPVKWAAVILSFGITWKILTSHETLPRLIQAAIEYAVAKSSPYVKPVLPLVAELRNFLEGFIPDQSEKEKIHILLDNIVSLFDVHISELMPEVQATLQGRVLEEAEFSQV